MLNVSWYYNWGAETALGAPFNSTFIPIVWGKTSISKIVGKPPILLGWNGPDNINQANITVAEGLKLWGNVSSIAGLVGSPATAGNPMTAGSWLQNFTSGSPTPKIDFITVHWYKGVDSTLFKNDI